MRRDEEGGTEADRRDSVREEQAPYHRKFYETLSFWETQHRGTDRVPET